MDVTGAIKARRSIRKFKRKEMPPEQMDHILEMARTAPSGANRQPWQMVVITDRQRLKDLIPICKDQAFVGDCSAFLIGVDDPQQKWAKVDLAIAMDHITLAAADEGLGTCWVGAFDQARMAEFIGLPADRMVTVCMALGYPDETPAPRGRKKAEDLFFWDRYGETDRQ